MIRLTGLRLGAAAIATLLGGHIAWVFATDTHLDPWALLLAGFTFAFLALIALLSVLD
jgi:hypothetical protein